MTVTINLPGDVEVQLKRKAKAQDRSIEELAVDILTEAVGSEHDLPTPEDVVAMIRSTPPNPQFIRLASGSLADALRDAKVDPEFDLAAWRRDWAAVELEMRATTCANRSREYDG